MDFARKLRDDRGRGNIVVVDDGEETEDQMGEDEYRVWYYIFFDSASFAFNLQSNLASSLACMGTAAWLACAPVLDLLIFELVKRMSLIFATSY